MGRALTLLRVTNEQNAADTAIEALTMVEREDNQTARIVMSGKAADPRTLADFLAACKTNLGVGVLKATGGNAVALIGAFATSSNDLTLFANRGLRITAHAVVSQKGVSNNATYIGTNIAAIWTMHPQGFDTLTVTVENA